MLLLIAIAVAISPFLTHYLSSLLFDRTRRSYASGKTPPTIPYWIPGVWPGISLIKEGLPTFIANTLKQYGSYAPFVVRAGPFSFAVVRDPNHVQKIFESEQMTPRGLHGRLFNPVMGQTMEAMKFVIEISSGRKKNDDLEYAQSIIPRKYCSGAGLKLMGDAYTDSLKHRLADKMFQDKTWTEIEDMWSFFQVEVTRATIEAIFGSSILKAYPRIVGDFWEFDATVEKVSHGLPQFIIPNAFSARDRLLENITKWLRSNHGTGAFAKSQENLPGRDANGGSEFFQATNSTLEKIGSIDPHARASAILSIMHWSISNAVPSTLWSILETLRNPALTKHFSTEMGRHYEPSTGTYNIDTLTAIPIFESLHTEVGRLRTATCAIRVNEGQKVELDDQWSIPKGMEVRMFSQDLALDADLWSKARPETLEKPLSVFWPERFITTKTKENKNEVRYGTFSTASVSALLTAFGGAQHLCPGRFLTKAIQGGSLAVLLNEYEIQFSDPEATELALPPVPGVAYGTIKPLQPIRIRIRKRPIRNDTKA